MEHDENLDKDNCTYCKTLPKIELHAHLNGSLSTETLRSLGGSENAIVKYKELDKLLDKSEVTLNKCMDLFKVAHELTKTKEAVYFATESVIREFAQDNVIYLELRTTPRKEEGMTSEEYLESVISAIRNNKTDLSVKLICSIDRRHDLNFSEKSLDTIINMKEKYPDVIKGVDLCGNPSEGTFNEELFKSAGMRSLSVTLHCAEVKNDAEVLKMLQFKPDRLGHCTYLHPKYGGSQTNWNLYRKLKIPTECCMTSNILCGTSANYTQHHVAEFINNHLPFTLSTDDKGVFSTTLSKEYHHAHRAFGLTEKQLWNISFQSIDYAFASEEEKGVLKEHMKSWLHNRQQDH